MAWLTRDGQALATVTIARTAAERRRGLLGLRADQLPSEPWALHIPRCRSVHTVGMQFPIDVIYLASTGAVLEMTTMVPGRLGMPRIRAKSVLELAAGQCAALGLAIGDHVEVSP